MEENKENTNAVAIKKLEKRINSSIEEMKSKLKEIDSIVNNLTKRVSIISKVLGGNNNE